MSRVLETVLTGRNLLSPMLASASRDVVAFNSTVAGANAKASTSAATSAGVQQGAAAKIAASNAKASTSATVSANTQARAHARAAESAGASARIQESANRALATSNGLLGTSLTPLTVGAGAAALSLGYAAFRGMEFGTAMSRVQAATQAGAADMGRLRESAISLGADTQFSSVEAAAGITEMAKAGVSTANILNGGLKGALDLAAAGELEVADAAEIGATALNVFRLEGNQMSHVADLLAAGAGKAQGSVHDLGMALNQSALVASATGLSIEETTGTLAAFASAGLIGSDAGTSFRSMLLHLQNPSKESAATMADLGISMYDANGAFVGMESLAGQLQTRMAGLTQAERDKAMATIFGSDAVRAANVLYEQGQRGIAGWTAKVNDAGYAARQAAQLNDNLAGDLEKLGGAVDSFFTSAGEGVQGPLRLLVQALTAIVSVGGDLLGVWNSLPGPVQVAIGTLAAVAALKGPLGSFFDFLAPKITGLVTGVGMATTTMGGFRGAASGLLGVLGGPWGLAIAGAVTGISLLVSWLSDSSDGTDDAADATLNLVSALEATKGAIDETVRAGALKDLRDEDLVQWADHIGVSLETLIDAALGSKDALATVQGANEAYIGSLAGMGVGFAGAKTGLEGNYAALLGIAGATGEAQTSQEQYTAAIEGGTSETHSYADALDEAQGKARGLKDALDALNGGQLSLNDANRNYQESLSGVAEILDKARQGVEGYNTSLDISTESGRRNQAALDEQAQSAADVANSLYDTTGSYDQFRGSLEQARTDLFNNARAFFDSEQATWAYVDSVLAIPSEAVVKTSAPGARTAWEEIVAVREAVRSVPPGHTVNVGVVSDEAMQKLQTLGYTVTTMPDGSVTVSANTAQAELDLNYVARARTMLITPVVTSTGVRRGGGTLGGTILEADGGIVKYYAGGGFHRENHVAQVASAGVTRVWAEPETGGELYAPLAASKRQRSLAVIGTQLDEWGYGMVRRGRDVGGGFPAAPAAMPGYGGAGGRGGQQVIVIEKRTEIAVDATGYNADQIAAKVVARQHEHEFLTSG